MAKNSKLNLGDLIDDITNDINMMESEKVKIPDIITFVESKDWLGLANREINPITLYHMQRIMLKAFYRGSLGNENLKLTQSEIKMCMDCGLDSDDKGDLINKYNSGVLLRELVLVWGRRCLSEDMTIINPKDGSINILGDMYDRDVKNINSWTYDEEKNKMVQIKDAEIIYQGERECYKLTTNSGHKIECTDNHPFLTQRGWVNLEDLNIKNDKVAIVEEVPFFGKSKKINEDEASVLGYMTGDGNCSQRSTFFTCNNKDALKDFTNKLNNISDNLKIFNDPWTGAKSKKFQYKITSDSYVNKTIYCDERKRNFSRRDTNDLVKLLEKWGLMGKTCHSKTVPLELFKCPKNVVTSYLRALFTCDGNLGTRNACTFEFTTVNKSQAELIQQLLHKFGIISGLRKKKVNSSIMDEKGIIKTYNTHCYVLSFSRKKYINIFLKEISFTGKNKYIQRAIKRLKKVDGNRKTSHSDNAPFSLYKIKKVEFLGKKRTFDLSVSHDKDKQNFVSEGFILHNSGKDFIVSIIALYEAMKLLECPGGDPYAMYELSSATPINILTVANAKPQAQIAFNEIKEKLVYSPYFRDKFVKEGMTSSAIYLLTPQDKKDNLEFKGKGMPQKKGSVGIIVGHSNSDSLLGMGCIVLILDEVASYKATGGASSGDRIYTALTPTVQTYVRKTYVKDANNDFIIDEHGQKVIDTRIYDGKIISISSPRAQEGKFYEMFRDAGNVSNRLAMRLPTWEVNTQHDRQILRDDVNTMSETEFNMEFGAEFSGMGLESFFTEDQVNSCFNGHGLRDQDIGTAGNVYFIHIDPASSSHNYALVVLHKEYFMDPETKKAQFMVIIDHIKHWSPVHGPINPEEVTHYILNLKRRFRIGLLTYDSWACVSPEEYLYSNNGIVKASSVKIGDSLLSKNGIENKIVSIGCKNNVDGFEIETKFGYKLKANDIHPVFVKDKGFVEMKDVEIGQNILLKDCEYSFGKINKPEEALLMGYLISEGSIYYDKRCKNKYPVIDFSNTDEYVVEEYIECCKNVLKKAPSVYPQEGKGNYKKEFKVTYSSQEYCNKIINMGMRGKCNEKEVPDFVLRGNEKTVSNFLSSLFEGDGSISAKCYSLSIQYYTTSQILAKQVQLLLLSFGIKSSLKCYDNKCKYSNRHPIYHVTIYGNNILTFNERIGFRSPTKKIKIQKCVEFQKSNKIGSYKRKSKGIRKSVNKKSRSKYMYDKIVKITSLKTDIVHIEVDGDHTYIANGIISHNSQESIRLMRKTGIPNKETKFTGIYKVKIYRELENLVNSKRIRMPLVDSNGGTLLRTEMLELQRKFTPTGFKILPKSEGDGAKSDDIIDCVAGAAYVAIEKQISRLPNVMLVECGNPGANGQIWKGPQGVIGIGQGTRVAKQIENRDNRLRYGRR